MFALMSTSGLGAAAAWPRSRRLRKVAATTMNVFLSALIWFSAVSARMPVMQTASG